MLPITYKHTQDCVCTSQLCTHVGLCLHVLMEMGISWGITLIQPGEHQSTFVIMALVPVLLAGHHMEPTTIWKIKIKWRHLRPHLVTAGYDNCISFWVKPIDQWQEDTSTAIPTLTGCTMWLGGDFLLRQSHLAYLDPAWRGWKPPPCSTSLMHSSGEWAGVWWDTCYSAVSSAQTCMLLYRRKAGLDGTLSRICAVDDGAATDTELDFEILIARILFACIF
jgi:hypothetical protein